MMGCPSPRRQLDSRTGDGGLPPPRRGRCAGPCTLCSRGLLPLDSGKDHVTQCQRVKCRAQMGHAPIAVGSRERPAANAWKGRLASDTESPPLPRGRPGARATNPRGCVLAEGRATSLGGETRVTRIIHEVQEFDFLIFLYCLANKSCWCSTYSQQWRKNL